jgi:hypothetical protein
MLLRPPSVFQQSTLRVIFAALAVISLVLSRFTWFQHDRRLIHRQSWLLYTDAEEDNLKWPRMVDDATIACRLYDLPTISLDNVTRLPPMNCSSNTSLSTPWVTLKGDTFSVTNERDGVVCTFEGAWTNFHCTVMYCVSMTRTWHRGMHNWKSFFFLYLLNYLLITAQNRTHRTRPALDHQCPAAHLTSWRSQTLPELIATTPSVRKG